MRIETERLVLRRWRPEDIESLAAILLHPAVLAWLGPPDASRDDVADALARYDRHWEAHGFGRLAVVDRGTGELVGRTGVMREPDWEATACKDEIGWAIAGPVGRGPRDGGRDRFASRRIRARGPSACRVLRVTGEHRLAPCDAETRPRARR
jgi:RimJ/RimL family protein N-acetyltransferase